MKTLDCKSPARPLLALIFCMMTVAAGARHGVAAGDQPTAKTTDKKATPIEITAQRLISDTANNQAEFVGNVRASQGKTVITADSIKIFFAGQSDPGQASPTDALEKLVATGNVEIKFDNRLAVARQAVYITAQRELTLTGPGARVTSGDNTITGETITFYRDDGRFTVEGGSDGRVKAVILPEASGLE